MVDACKILRSTHSLATRILNLFSRDTYVVDSILARVCTTRVSLTFLGPKICLKVISGLVRTTALCGSILVVIGQASPC